MLINLASASGDVNSARVLKIFPTFNNLYVCTVIGALPGAPRCQQNTLYDNSTLQARTGFGQIRRTYLCSDECLAGYQGRSSYADFRAYRERKTLAAFYGAIDDLLQKGLNNQLEEGPHSLCVPIESAQQRHSEKPRSATGRYCRAGAFIGPPPVDIRVGVRTGDTPACERQKMARHPPHILVTTPESLYLLLTSASGRAMLATVSKVIVDEIHALLGDKRGSHLALSLERLQLLCRKSTGQHLQRIGLSATQRPIEMVARYLIGGAGSQEEVIACDIVDSVSVVARPPHRGAELSSERDHEQ